MRVNDLAVGQRVRLRRELSRRGDTFAEGSRGTVVTSTEERLVVAMDAGVELDWWRDWESEVHQPVLDLELVNEPLEDVCEAIRRYGLGECDSVTLDEAVFDELGSNDTVLGVAVYVLPETPPPTTVAESFRDASDVLDDLLEAVRLDDAEGPDSCAISVDAEVARELRLAPGERCRLWGRLVVADEHHLGRCHAVLRWRELERTPVSPDQVSLSDARASVPIVSRETRCELGDGEHGWHRGHLSGGDRLHWRDDNSYERETESGRFVRFVAYSWWPWQGQDCRAHQHEWTEVQDDFIRNLVTCRHCGAVRSATGHYAVEVEPGVFA